MGGNAFPNTVRLDVAFYDLICDFIKSYNNGIMIPRVVGEKSSFGDIDTYSSDPNAADWIRYNFVVLEEKRHPTSINFLIDTSWGHVQLDLEKLEDYDDFAIKYFSFNDLGNLVGRIAHRQGLKFGHRGLRYVLREGSRQISDLLVTDNYEEALEYLGFDSKKFEEGFTTYSEMFDWVVNSKYFEPCAYSLENMSHQSRTRDRKRKTFHMFLDYLGDTGEYTPSDKANALNRHLSYFPSFNERMEEAIKIDARKQLIKSKFNGLIVANTIPGLVDVELGKFMSYLRNHLTDDFVLSSTNEQIEDEIRAFYDIYSKR